MKFMATDSNFFLDSNVWLYALSDDNDEKALKARELVSNLGGSILFTAQVANEVCLNLKRKSSMSEVEIRRLIASFFLNCKFVEIDEKILKFASDLRERHAFSFWDSIIVSSAFAVDAYALYSEDMQDGFVVDNKLKIVNPFKN